MKSKIFVVGWQDIKKRVQFYNHFLNEFDIIFIGLSTKKDREQIRGIKYFQLSPFSVDMLRLFKYEKPQIVHTYDTIPNIYGRIAAKIAGIPIIIGTFTGLGRLYTDCLSTFDKPLRFIFDLLVYLSSKYSTFTIFQNPDDRNELIEKKLVSEDASLVIRSSGIDTQTFSPSKINLKRVEDLRNKIGIPRDFKVVTMVSRVMKQKGVYEFAIAAKIVRSRHTKTFFLLVGEREKKLIGKIKKGEWEEITNLVTWIGKQTKIREIIALSDIIVLPSYYREGVPRVLLEGAAMEKPLVAADVPGSREVVIDGVTGKLVKPRDPLSLSEAIQWMISHPVESKRMGKRARELVRREFDISIIVHKTKNLYKNCLEKITSINNHYHDNPLS